MSMELPDIPALPSFVEVKNQQSVEPVDSLNSNEEKEETKPQVRSVVQAAPLQTGVQTATEMTKGKVGWQEKNKKEQQSNGKEHPQSQSIGSSVSSASYIKTTMAKEENKTKRVPVKTGKFGLTVANVTKLLGVSAEVFDECIEYNFHLSEIEEKKNEKNGKWVRPEADETLKRLYQTPARLDFVNQLIVEVETMVKQTQFDISSKEEDKAAMQAEERKKAVEDYMKKLEEFPDQTAAYIKKFQVDMGGVKLNSDTIKHMMSQKKPEKPTVNYLEDVASIRTKEQTIEIRGLKSELLEQEELLRRLQRVQRRYNDDKFAVQKFVEYLIAELKNLGSGI